VRIIDILKDLDYDKFNIFESDKEFSLELKMVKNLMDKNDIYSLLNIEKKYDKIKLVISYYGEQVIEVNKNSKPNILDEFFESEKECIDLTIEIDKSFFVEKYDNQMKFINIYEINSFLNYLKSKELTELLEFFAENLDKWELLHFLTDDNIIYIQTPTIIIGNSKEFKVNIDTNRFKILDRLIESRNFINDTSIFLIPEDFDIIESNDSVSLNGTFNCIKSCLSLMYISDSSSIKEECLEFIIMGKKRIFSFNESFSIYYKLYQWIFENENFYERLMISKNIISSQNKDKIDKETFNNILSNYLIMQKENVSKYFDLKKDLSKSIIEISDEFSKIVSSSFSAFLKNVIAFFTFVFTVVIVNSASSNSIDNIFTKDITFITVILIHVSYIMLVITYVQNYFEIRRINEVYKKLEINYMDVFKEETEDLLSIINFKDIERETKKNSISLLIIWAIIVTLLLIVIWLSYGNLLVENYLHYCLLYLVLLLLMILYLIFKIYKNSEKK